MLMLCVLVTGESRRAAFIEFVSGQSCSDAYRNANKAFLDGQQILVDYQRGGVMESWIPRRFGQAIFHFHLI